MLKRLFTKEIDDEYVQENFIRLNAFADSEGILKSGFKHFEVEFAAPTYPSTVSFFHRLGYVPKDVLVTSSIGPGVATFEYALFSNTQIYVTITDAVTVRFFLGTYAEGNIR